MTGERIEVQRTIAAQAWIFPVISAGALRPALGILARTMAHGGYP